MKKNKFYFTGVGFLAGLMVAGSVVGFFAFRNSPSGPDASPAVSATSAAVANGYLKNYLSGASPLNQVLKGFRIDVSQLNAMNMIIKENPALAGFRVYLGKDNNAQKVAIVVGVDSGGRDAVGNTIYTTDSPGTDPCPPVCDASSTITNQ